VPGLLSPEICDALIAAARPRLAPAMIYDELRGGETAEDGRRLMSARFGVTDTELVLMAVNERLCALVGLPPCNAEGLQVMHYEVGDYFAPHFDAWDPAFAGHAGALAEQGQRLFTVLVYLNDDLEGGETDFPRLGIRHRGRKGDGLMFRNVDAEGGRDHRLLHAGLPPTKGEKWLLSLWIRERAPLTCGDPRVTAAIERR
jgi:prolyl 4-hydroxylase